MLSHHIIPNFLTDEEKEFFLSLIDSNEFINHKSTITGLPSPLNFLPVSFRGIEKALLMKMYPNVQQPWHVDGANLKRNTVIIHPITDNYAPLITIDGEVSNTAILNTQIKHAVFNNNCVRLNLQIPINLSFEELMQNKKHSYWTMIEGLYK